VPGQQRWPRFARTAAFAASSLVPRAARRVASVVALRRFVNGTEYVVISFFKDNVIVIVVTSHPPP
jgi:hypothetical protein